jgi:hypothetical protein
MTSKCDIDLWPKDLVHARNTNFHSGEHLYEVSLETFHMWDMLWTKSLYSIIFSDLDLAYINLNYMFHTSNHENDHLCFYSSITDDKMVPIHIFIWTLTPHVWPWPWTQGPPATNPPATGILQFDAFFKRAYKNTRKSKEIRKVITRCSRATSWARWQAVSWCWTFVLGF